MNINFLHICNVFFYNIDCIYNNTLWGKKLFNNWKSLKININSKNNQYYKELFIKDSFKSRIVFFIYERNYLVGKILYRILNK